MINWSWCVWVLSDQEQWKVCSCLFTKSVVMKERRQGKKAMEEHEACLPGVDAADHVLGQVVWGCVLAGTSCLGHQQDHQTPHLKVVSAVIDEAPEKRARHQSGIYCWVRVYTFVEICSFHTQKRHLNEDRKMNCRWDRHKSGMPWATSWICQNVPFHVWYFIFPTHLNKMSFRSKQKKFKKIRIFINPKSIMASRELAWNCRLSKQPLNNDKENSQ